MKLNIEVKHQLRLEVVINLICGQAPFSTTQLKVVLLKNNKNQAFHLGFKVNSCLKFRLIMVMEEMECFQVSKWPKNKFRLTSKGKRKMIRKIKQWASSLSITEGLNKDQAAQMSHLVLEIS